MKYKTIYGFIAFMSIFGQVVASEKASLRKSIDEFIEKYNTDVRTESSAIYKGQMAGYATAGGVTVRNRVINRKPLAITMPNVSAGCGGIDLHMGSFSWMNGEELQGALKNIASSASTYAFLLGIKTISPQIEGTLTTLQSWANTINSLNINSCEVGQQLAASVYPASKGASEFVCQTIGTEGGLFSDRISSRHGCNSGMKDHVQDKEKYGDAFIGEFNVAWEAIKRNDYISKDPNLAYLVMSITGTIIRRDDQNGIEKVEYVPSLIHNEGFVKALFSGGDIDLYFCKDNSKNIFDTKTMNCIEIEERKSSLSENDSWFGKIRDDMIQIQTKIINDEELEEKEKSLLLKTSLPIARIICALTAYHRGKCPIDLYRIAEIVAMDVMCQFLRECVDSVHHSSRSLRNAQFYAEEIDQFTSDLHRVQDCIKGYENKAKSLMEEEFHILQTLKLIEEQLALELSL